MGLFSAIGKVLKGVSKVAGFIPGVGSTISKVAGTIGNVLDHKAPMSTTSTKLRLAQLGKGAGVVYMRGKSSNLTAMNQQAIADAQVLRASPVLPGGAYATASGPMPKASAPPRTYGGKRTAKKSYTRKKSRAKARKGGRKRTTRKLKFGSAAYRKKYLGHR